ncbi:MAG: hypothetical protein NTV51_02325, partial [Verrucomicrobia bacterium]|nr:hypothetical protein [Verrucomicrobiota bacterium]
DLDMLRWLLAGGMVFSAMFGLLTFLLHRHRAMGALGIGAVGDVVATLAHRGTAGAETARWIAALVGLIGPALLAKWPRGQAQVAAESPRGGTHWFTVAVGVLYSLVVAAQRNDGPQGLAVITGFALLAVGLLAWVWLGALRVAAWVLTLVTVLLIGLNSGARMVPMAVAAVTVAWIPALVWSRWDRVRERWTAAGANPGETALGQTWLAGLASAVAITCYTGGDVRVAWFAGAGAAALGLARLGFPAVVEVATGFVVLGLARAAELVLRRDLEVSNLGGGFAAVAGIAVVATLLARFLPAGRLWASATMRAARAWIFPGAGLALAFGLMLAQRGGLQPYVTVGWGVAALAWFGFGLFARSRPDRLLGLAGLALCVPRTFLVDLHSTLYRIVAFGALGAVLLWVGFSYHRFRHLIADDAAPGGDGSDKKL